MATEKKGQNVYSLHTMTEQKLAKVFTVFVQIGEWIRFGKISNSQTWKFSVVLNVCNVQPLRKCLINGCSISS